MIFDTDTLVYNTIVVDLLSDKAELDRPVASNSGTKKAPRRKKKPASTAVKGPSRKSRRLADKPGQSVQYNEDSDSDGEASTGRSRREGSAGAVKGAR